MDFLFLSADDMDVWVSHPFTIDRFPVLSQDTSIHEPRAIGPRRFLFFRPRSRGGKMVLSEISITEILRAEMACERDIFMV